mmetsp:Transcript_13181/g.25177  ORF Transcript_13181/g.25177 Transcript_13181/m.25177 type:complete len:203 (-) Transcript_13181:3056-3664(-)
MPPFNRHAGECGKFGEGIGRAFILPNHTTAPTTKPRGNSNGNPTSASIRNPTIHRGMHQNPSRNGTAPPRSGGFGTSHSQRGSGVFTCGIERVAFRGGSRNQSQYYQRYGNFCHRVGGRHRYGQGVEGPLGIGTTASTTTTTGGGRCVCHAAFGMLRGLGAIRCGAHSSDRCDGPSAGGFVLASLSTTAVTTCPGGRVPVPR